MLIRKTRGALDMFLKHPIIDFSSAKYNRFTADSVQEKQKKKISVCHCGIVIVGEGMERIVCESEFARKNS